MKNPQVRQFHWLALIVFGLSASHTSLVFSDTAICGPRCVREVCSRLGLKVPDLAALVSEMQESYTSGCTFSDIVSALERRGVHSRLVAIRQWDWIGWNEPIIMHVDGDHFIVIDSPSRFGWTVSDGPQPPNWQPFWKIRMRSTGAYLITSTNPIEAGVVPWSYWPRYVVVLVLAIAAIGTLRRFNLGWLFRGMKPKLLPSI